MDHVIIGGDERFAWLARLLHWRGVEVGTIFREPVPDVPDLGADELRNATTAVVNYPPKLPESGMTFEELLAELPGDARIFACGPWHPDEDARVIDLWADEALTRENARLTAEGALASAMQASESALRDMRCMLIGWGRIGQALTELLVAMGARVTVASRLAAGRNRAVERGAEAVYTGEIVDALPGHQLIFNTAPGMVLDAAALKSVDREVMIIDLASPPYGVDLRAAWDMGLRAWREPGLPGRYCPRSAAMALLAAMERCDRGGKRHE